MNRLELLFAGISVAGAAGILAAGLSAPSPAEAIPPFARRTEMACGSCHQGHYPRLNAFGRQYRDNGYQMPGGAEDAVRRSQSVQPAKSEGLTVFRDVPLSVRGQVFGVAPAAPDAADQPVFRNSLFAFLIGGGSVGRDVSYLFTWTPWRLGGQT